ncbi:putative 15-hydroxyprostaglandin dehydrogenase protein [Neofusicoccum parvum]|uniref:15-hydroxyprostaglandin dehydrogenase protein n=1 Tax=Neofusicoccum parvum TaxID=310453 RepID=A0ACB5S6C0_9PEZI|nr:putative 15-hydroxyprostaglandin dehydrogenase protein [Neofusicoccum parvum]GME63071.1 putative 15-hydroxyprostaglandin dehydrogenase protein [Neofusicoccum parvum]
MASTPVQEKVAIVTGATVGSPSGIGAALAKDLITSGYRVALVARRSEPGTRLAASLGPSARFFSADVSSYDEQARAFAAVWAAWGRLDVVCANAGIVDKSSAYVLDWRGKPVDEPPPAPDLACTDADWKGVVYGTRLATHFMRQNRPVPGGRIVATGSVGAIFPHRTYPEYCAAKAAVVQFVRAVAPVLKEKDNITINVVHPGIVDTPIVPPEMIAAVSRECLTPVETILKGYRVFLEDETGMTGKNMEASGKSLHYYEMPEMANGRVTKRSVTVWEPLFLMMHHEKSGLPDAIE